MNDVVAGNDEYTIQRSIAGGFGWDAVHTATGHRIPFRHYSSAARTIVWLSAHPDEKDNFMWMDADGEWLTQKGLSMEDNE